MALTAYLNHTPSKLSFFAWNINGLSSKSLGDKLQNVNCLRVINGYEHNIEVAGYQSVVSVCSNRHLKNSKKGSKLRRIGFTVQK